jgi:peptidoglycan/LPS O-acetylase OafA/YrhL
MAPGQSNNLHAVRLALAAAVIVSHAWPLAYGAGTTEPLKALSGHSLGGWAVGLFFFLSGMLIAGSAGRNSAARFWAARARRILPGLAMALLVTLAIAAASGATLTPGIAATYFLRGITLISLEHQLVGAFANAPIPGVVNGPLWSLAHEVAAYALCWGAARLGLLRTNFGLGVLMTAALILWAIPALPARAATFAPLFVAFSLGMLAHALRAHLPLSPLLTLALLALAPLGWPFAIAALGHGALMLAFRLPARPLAHDLSFGLYIYGWPVAQVLMHHLPGLTAPQLAVLSLLATLPFAALSWRLVEAPMLPRPTMARA